MIVPSIQWVLGIVTAVGVVLSSAPAFAASGDSDDPKWCRTCHDDAPFSSAQFKLSAHKDQTCRDCHQGFQFNPHEPVEEAKGDGIDALKKRGFKNPIALNACMDCHDSPSDVPGSFPHGKQKDGTKAGLPYCLDCHGDPHEIRLMKGQPANVRRVAMNIRCIKCHGDAKKMAPFHLRADIVAAYEHTMHAVKLDLGSPDAPGCADCHPAHPARDDKKKAALALGACVKCHAGANPKFKDLASHKPMTRADRPISYFTIKFFAWLTFLTILGLSLHVLLDVINVVRRAGAPSVPHKQGKEGAASLDPVLLGMVSEGRIEPTGTVLRFDLNQRFAHGIMALSFTTLVLTGWPLSSHGIGASHFLVSLFGGLQSLGWLHRAAAVGLIIACVYHLAYLGVQMARGKLRFSMLPALKDAKDAVANILYFLGMRAEKPAYHRFSYFEKFDYWAVFWGCVIMVGSGAVRWFPTQVMRFAPTWLYEVCYLAHTDEALLAALAIFVWHFYNVHLRPAVFPMSWVFLTGRMSMEEHAEEHAAEHEAWLQAAKAKARLAAPATVEVKAADEAAEKRAS